MLKHTDDACMNPRGSDCLRGVFADLDGLFITRGWGPNGPDGFQQLVDSLARPLPGRLVDLESTPEQKLNSVIVELANSVNAQRLANNPVTLSSEAIGRLYSEVIERLGKQ